MQIEETKRYKRIQKYAKLGAKLLRMKNPAKSIAFDYEVFGPQTVVYVNMRMLNGKKGGFGFNMLWDENRFNKALSDMVQFIANELSKVDDIHIGYLLEITPEEKMKYQIRKRFEDGESLNIKGEWLEVMLEVQEKNLLDAKVRKIDVNENCITLYI